MRLSIDNIYSKHYIGNTLDIKMRQKAGSELPWASIIQGNPTLVQLATMDFQPGKYELVFESIDDNSSVKSVLKTDKIVLNVTACQISHTQQVELQSALDKWPIELSV